VAQAPHTQLLTEAARRALRPLGLQQKGRSRTWLDDRGWWTGVVEFQPSSWSKGSYLNVGVNWLWFEKKYLSFDYGYRLGGFVSFEDEAQFARVAENLAESAANEIRRLRSLFDTVSSAAKHLAARPERTFWNDFHAGVACGLAGETRLARRAFRKVTSDDDDSDWVKAAVALAQSYSLAVEDLASFRSKIQTVIHRARVLLRLPEVANIVLD
jgi:hypothetical protein